MEEAPQADANSESTADAHFSRNARNFYGVAGAAVASRAFTRSMQQDSSSVHTLRPRVA
jgi:hypothetical protein